MNLAKDELRNYVDLKCHNLQLDLSEIESNVIPKNELNSTLSKLVSIETIDKLYRNVQGLKSDIEKSMEIKINAELSDFKIDLAKKLNIEDAEIQFSKYLNLEEFESQIQKNNNLIYKTIDKKLKENIYSDDDQSES